MTDQAELNEIVARYVDTALHELPKDTTYHATDTQRVLQIVSTPQFQAALRKHLALELQNGAAASIKLLQDVVKDDKLYPRDRIGAAKHLLSIAGYIAPRAQDQKHATASPSEMTSEDLRAFIGKAEQELAGRAAPVNAQIEDDLGGQVADML